MTIDARVTIKSTHVSLIHLSLVSHTSLIPVSRHSLTQNPPWRNRSSKLSGVPLIERQCFYMPGEIEIQVEFKLKLLETIMYFPKSFRELNLENWESGEGEIKCDIISIDEMTINVPSLGGLPSVWYLSGFAIIGACLPAWVSCWMAGWSLEGWFWDWFWNWCLLSNLSGSSGNRRFEIGAWLPSLSRL